MKLPKLGVHNVAVYASNCLCYKVVIFKILIRVSMHQNCSVCVVSWTDVASHYVYIAPIH